MSGYGWKQVLVAAVSDGDSVIVATPGASDPYCKLDEATLAVANVVVPQGKFTLTLDVVEQATSRSKKSAVVTAPPPGQETCTLTNASGEEWPAGAEIYVGVAGVTLGDVAGAAEGNAEAIATQQAAIDMLNELVSDLQTNVTDLESRVAALEAASGA